MQLKKRLLLTGIIALAVISCGFWIARQSRRDAEAVRKIEALGGTVRMADYGRCVDFCFVEITDVDLPVLLELSNLRMLDLRFSQVSDQGLRIVGNLTGLTNLNLANTQVTGQGLAHLNRLRLQGLNLQRTNLTDSDVSQLAGMTSLRRLDLSSTNISDQSVGVLSKLSGLNGINLAGTKMTTAGVNQLKKSLPKVQIVGGDDDDQSIVDSGLTFPGEPSWAASIGRRTVREVKPMKSPVQLVEAVAFNDGGTLGAQLRDATGQDLIFCFSSDAGWSDFKPGRVYIGGFHPTTPGSRLLPLEGEELPRLIRLLKEGLDNAESTLDKDSIEHKAIFICGPGLLSHLEQLAGPANVK